jgi:multiple sugar transport system ATP-binding protein
MVFQNYALYPHMTVYDNMAFGLRLRKQRKKEIDQRVRHASDILGIQDLLDRLPKALSGGQRQRVAMGRAIVREPAVFLFDEPLSNLDAKMRVGMRKEILHLHQRIKTTMVYVTHDQVEAMTLGDRIVVMKDGRVMQVAEPLVVYHCPANVFVARFIGTPPMNLFAGTLARDGDRFVFHGGEIRVPLPRTMDEAIRDRVGAEVFFGIRPEDFVLKEKVEDPGIAIQGTVDVCEWLGNETLIHLMVDGEMFQCRVGSHQHPALTGERLAVCPALERAHIFDGASGRNLTLPDYAVESVTPHDLTAKDLLADVQQKEGS